MALLVGALGMLLEVASSASEKEKLASTEKVSGTVTLRGRVVYRAAAGARIVGKPVADPTGEAIAFFEQTTASVVLVVAMRGAEPARWPVLPEAAQYQIFWLTPTDIILGPTPLKPRIKVTWEVARE